VIGVAAHRAASIGIIMHAWYVSWFGAAQRHMND